MGSTTPVILCGGSGTRLWPLSRKSFPKQFVPLLGEKSLLALTIERLLPLISEAGRLMLVASDEHRFLVAETLRQAGVSQAEILLEPMGRNTAAAIAWACLQASPTDLLLFCPSDQHIQDEPAFRAAVQKAAPVVAAGEMVLFGIAPTHPATGYGYIQAVVSP